MSFDSARQIQQHPQQNDMSLVSQIQIEQPQPQQNDMPLFPWRQIAHQQPQPQQHDMSLVSGTQIEQQQPPQNDMSWNTEPRMCAVERVHFQPCFATPMTNFHPGFIGNMEEEALAHDNPLARFGNIAITENFSKEQLVDNFHVEQALANDHHPFATFTNIANIQNSQLGTLDNDTSLVHNPTMLKINDMHHNQMYPLNFQPSSTIISGNPTFVSQNYNFGMNVDHGSHSIQQGGDNIGEAIVDQYSTGDSIYLPQFQNASLPSDTVRRFAGTGITSQVFDTGGIENDLYHPSF